MSESLAQAQRQMDDDDDIEPFPGPPHTYTTNFHGGDGEGWRKRNILSLGKLPLPRPYLTLNIAVNRWRRHTRVLEPFGFGKAHGRHRFRRRET